MDFNGEQAEGGAAVLPDDIDINSVCAATGTFQSLGVGACGAPSYTFPTANKPADYPSVRVEAGGDTIDIDVVNSVVQMWYPDIGVDSFTVPTGTYTVSALVKAVQDAFNTKYAAQTNVMRMWVSNNGRVQASITAGTQTSFRMANTLCLRRLGNTTDSGNVVPNTIWNFASDPEVTGSTLDPKWAGYRFDDTGAVFQGDLTVTGALTTNTIVSELQVEDSIINCNLNAPVDNFSAGLVINTFDNLRFSGLMKSDSGNDFHLFADSATVPTASGWVPVNNANLYLRTIKVNDPAGQSTISVVGDNSSQPTVKVDCPVNQVAPIQEWRTNGLLQASIDAGGQLNANVVDSVQGNFTNLKNGALTNDFSFPGARGLAGQVIVATGTGETTAWQDPAVGSSIESPNAGTKVETANGLLTAEVDGTAVLNATASTTTLKGGGVEDPQMVLRSGLNSSFIQRDGRDILSFGPTLTRLGFDGTIYDEYISNTKTSRINSIIRERIDLTTHSLSDAATVDRIGYDGTKSFLTAPAATSTLELTDASLTATIGGQQRLNATAAATTIDAPSGTTQLELTDGSAVMQLSGSDVLNAQPLVTTLSGGPAGFSSISVGGNIFGIDLNFNGDQRIGIKNTGTFVKSANLTTEIDVDDSQIRSFVVGQPRLTLSSSKSSLADSSGVDKVVSDGTSTRLIAPGASTTKLDVFPDSILAAGGFSINTADVNDIPLSVFAPVGQANDIAQYKVNAVNVSRIDNLGNHYMPNMFVTAANAAIAGLDASALNIAPSTSTQVNIGYSGIDTAVKGSLTTEEALNVDGDFVYSKGAFECYVQSNATPTPIVAINTPTRILFAAAATTSSFSQGWTIDTAVNVGRCTYNGNRRRVFHSGVTVSWVSDTNSVLATFSVHKNGVLIPGSKVRMFYANGANKFESSAIHIFADVVATDYIELYVECDTLCNITVEEANIFGLGLPNSIP